MNALRDVSKVWLVAKMVHTLFESILGNKAFEERLQKAAGRRHTKNKRENGMKIKEMQTNDTTNDAPKRKFDDMEFGYSNGPPAPQVSYERSRPQSPAMTPSRDLGGQAQSQQQIPRISAQSPSAGQNADNFLGASKPNTRPTTPFNPLSYPSTPPDLFLHTRNSPKISEDLWQNYQPDQLFPQEANGMFPLQSPGQSMVDPALRAPDQAFGMQQQASPGAMRQQGQMNDGMPQMYGQDANAWAQIQAMGGSGPRSDDVWSNSSMSGPTVPMALNVGDWFEFFGIPNAEMGALNGGLGSAYS